MGSGQTLRNSGTWAHGRAGLGERRGGARGGGGEGGGGALCFRAQCSHTCAGCFLLVLLKSLQVSRVSLWLSFLGLGYLSGETPAPVSCFQTLPGPREISVNLDLE